MCQRKTVVNDETYYQGGNQGLYSVHRFLCVYVTQTTIVPKYII